MNFNFVNLDETTRLAMLQEVEFDENQNQVYISKRFNETGISLYLDFLKKSIKEGNEEMLANLLDANICFKTQEERGGKMVKVPITASQTLSEGEFNRFYIRALCVLSIQNNYEPIVYRARHSNNPRPESEKILGTSINSSKLLEDLRKNIGVDTALGLPAGPNSGLSIKF